MVLVDAVRATGGRLCVVDQRGVELGKALAPRIVPELESAEELFLPNECGCAETRSSTSAATSLSARRACPPSPWALDEG